MVHVHRGNEIPVLIQYVEYRQAELTAIVFHHSAPQESVPYIGVEIAHRSDIAAISVVFIGCSKEEALAEVGLQIDAGPGIDGSIVVLVGGGLVLEPRDREEFD